MLHRSLAMGRLAKTAALFLLPGVLFLATSCSTFSWTTRPVVTEEQQALGVKSVEQLRSEYETQQYWAFWRDNLNGKFDAVGDGLRNMHETFDRHFMNYDWDAPNASR